MIPLNVHPAAQDPFHASSVREWFWKMKTIFLLGEQSHKWPSVHLFWANKAINRRRTFASSQDMSLYLDTQGESALPARDFSFAASVSGSHDRLQPSPLAAPGCLACALG